MMNGPKPEVPYLIEGGLHVDDRGQVTYVNDFSFEGIKRFYIIANHTPGFIRAWHAHKLEAKYVLALRGNSIVGAVALDDWENPDKNAQVHRYVLSERKPAILYIPPGYANGFMSLSQDTQMMFLSTATVEESIDDDYRYDAHYWDIWYIEER